MKLPRRRFLHLAAGAAASSAVPGLARAQTARQPSEQPAHPLAERLAAYADRLRYDDIDAATVERVKSHVIDVLGCGIAAFDEPPVRICRDVALATSGGASLVIGTARRTTPELGCSDNLVISARA
jgi:2-methylcitrate dehydratase